MELFFFIFLLIFFCYQIYILGIPAVLFLFFDLQNLTLQLDNEPCSKITVTFLNFIFYRKRPYKKIIRNIMTQKNIFEIYKDDVLYKNCKYKYSVLNKIFCIKAVILRYKPKYEQGYSRDCLTERVTN